jgi:hypothetical protein
MEAIRVTTWRIELSYPGLPTFASEQRGLILPEAIENAIHYAHACGWPIEPTKKRAIELTNNQEQKNGK